MSRDSSRASRDAQRSDHETGRAAHRSRPIAVSAQVTATKRLRAPSHLDLQVQEDEGHLPHHEYVLVRSEEHHSRVLGAAERDPAHQGRPRQGDQEAGRQLPDDHQFCADSRRAAHLQSHQQIHLRLPEYCEFLRCAQLSRDQSDAVLCDHVPVSVRSDVRRRRPRCAHAPHRSVPHHEGGSVEEDGQGERDILVVFRRPLHHPPHVRV